MIPVSVTTDLGVVTVLAETAITPEEISRGLQFRSLLPGTGMLFIFARERVRNFWMKDVPVPLDMIFASRDGVVVGIVHNAPAMSSRKLSVNAPSKFVLEVPAGWAQKNNVRAGWSMITF